MATNWPGGSALPRAHKKPWCKAKALREADKVRLLGAKIERDGTKYVPRVVRDKRGEPIRLFGGAPGLGVAHHLVAREEVLAVVPVLIELAVARETM